MAADAPMYVVILAGQSNMSGRGGVYTNPVGSRTWDRYVPFQAEPPAGRPFLLCMSCWCLVSTIDFKMSLGLAGSVLRWSADNSWEDAQEPLHWDVDVRCACSERLCRAVNHNCDSKQPSTLRRTGFCISNVTHPHTLSCL